MHRMRKDGPPSPTRTITVEQKFPFGQAYNQTLRAVAEIDQYGEATARIAIDFVHVEADAVGEMIRALQQAAEWVFDQRDRLVAERNAAAMKAAAGG